MNFISISFWVILLLLGVCAVVFKQVVRTDRYDRWILLVMSVVLFASESILSFGIFLVITLLTFVVLKLLEQGRIGLTPTLFYVLIAVCPLLFFKYAPSEWSSFSGGEVLIPIGISFYTFQLISLVVDHRKDSSSPISGLTLMNYASFFPQIVAGPIERKSNLMPQVEEFTFRLDKESVLVGIRFLILGFFYKLVLADNIATLTDGIHSPVKHPVVIHFCNFLFGIRIYGDFCGYSLIAYGIAKCLGVNLQLNFLSPYTAVNIQDFWRRWHITLSNWFRDYLYIPLGGNRTKFFLLTVLLVFVVSGVWHGSGWNFLLWGGLHGLGVTAVIVTRKRLKLPKFFAYLITMLYVSFTWLFFYQVDSGILLDKVVTIFDLRAYFNNPIPSMLETFGDRKYLLLCAAYSLFSMGVLLLEFFANKKGSSPYAWSGPIGMQILMLFTIIFFSPVKDNGFVYFNF